MNIFELYNGAKSLGGNRNYTLYNPDNMLKAVDLDEVANTVTFHILTKGSKPKEVYTSSLRFKVQVFETEPKDSFFAVVKNNSTFFVSKIAKNSDLEVSCTCQDYYWTFQHWNYIKGLHLGADTEPYEPQGTRPPRNPEHYNGICKHIYQAFVLLQNNGYIEG